MTVNLISGNTQELNQELEAFIKGILSMTKTIDHAELEQTVSDVLDRIHDPYMFVIVGEVKAGKSSFINALLGDESICKVAPSPMTDTIQQIVYGEESKTEEINPHFKRISQPVDILKEVAIVDTPGTNTIVEYHQEITERFIPSSDLIVFVFESKNPYRESAWNFFKYIQEEWRKKIIFILQQKDLMDPKDLDININGVKEYAIKKGIQNPNIFATSAKMELENLAGDSGFDEVKNYIRENITGGKAPYLKILNNTETALTINEKIQNGLSIRRQQYNIDLGFREEVKEVLDVQENRTSRQIDQMIKNLLISYDNVTLSKENELKEGLGIVKLFRRSFSAMFSGGDNAKQWLDGFVQNLERDLNLAMRNQLDNGVTDIAENIQDMGQIVDAKIKTNQTILKQDHELFSDIAEKRFNILRDLKDTFSKFLNDSENFYDTQILNENNKVTPNIAASSGIAVVGVILASVTNLMVLDITGGLLASVGLIFAGVTIGIKRKQILSSYREEVKKGRVEIEQEVSQKLKDYTSNIKQRIDEKFSKFDLHLQDENQTLEDLENAFHKNNEGILSIKSKVESYLKN